jgi:glycosyltransferase involved in cell wall biosynthesis
MALGIPVVATDVPGTRSLIQSGKNGLLIKLDDISSFSSALSSVLIDRTLARQLGENGKHLVQTEFDEYVVADRVEAIYNHILKKKVNPLPHWEPSNSL